MLPSYVSLYFVFLSISRTEIRSSTDISKLSPQLSSAQKSTKTMAPSSPLPTFPTYLLPSFSFSFRRRQASTSSTSTSSSPPTLSYLSGSSANTTPSSSPPTASYIPKSLLSEGLQSIFQKLEEDEDVSARLHRAQPNTLKCVTCSSDIAFADQIVSKGFTGRHGRAYLVGLAPPIVSTSNKKSQAKIPHLLPNLKIGRSVNRELLTGQHVVADVSCTICGTVLGWKYVDAREQAQKYKIGKYILEMKRVVLGVVWEDGDGDVELGAPSAGSIKLAGTNVEDDDDDVVLFDSEDEDECEDLFAGVWDAVVVAKRRKKRPGNRKRIAEHV